MSEQLAQRIEALQAENAKLREKVSDYEIELYGQEQGEG